MDKNLKTLELDKVLNLLSKEASCKEAKDITKNLTPSNDIDKVNELLKETYDAHMLIGRFGSPSFSDICDVNSEIARARVNGMLTMAELLKIARLLKALRGLKEWRKKSDNLSTVLDPMFDVISPNKYFEEKIFNSIISDDEMADEASYELSLIRRKMRKLSDDVRVKMDKIIHNAQYQKYLQDPIVTIRSGRFVVPVKSEYRSFIPGLLHDTSSSGATVFIEPMSIVELNNEIKILESKEKTEIEKILLDLTVQVSSFSDNIIKGYESAVKIDVIFSKAHLAYKMSASVPIINEKGYLDIKKARHPLIDKDKVVPIDINLGKDFDTLIITGPNTGGKTVTLKTVGLLTLMAMCGLMVPCGDNSEVCIFEKILVDIGDEQSIEQSLSTFSSHMTNIIDIIEKVNDKSLVLLDELGSGTDPAQGAALAISILETVSKKGAKILSTTHYSEIKSYSIQTDRVENACCEFDINTLKPTYKLLIGLPGKSNAFEISKRLGMQDCIIERAKQIVSDENLRFEKIIDSLEKSRQEIELEKNKAKKLSEEALRVKKEADEYSSNIKREYKEELERAKQQAQKILGNTRIQADILLEEIEKIKKSKDNTLQAKQRINRAIKELEDKAHPVDEKKNNNYKLPRELKAGDQVLIFDIDKKAEVLEKADKSGNVLVKAGIIKTRVPVSNLRLIENDKSNVKNRSVTRNVRDISTSTVNTEIDVRGMNSVEAIMEVDKFIDNAIMTGINMLTIIHGKGTGVLRKEISKHLKGHPSVKSYRLGVFGEGESGVTIVLLK